MWCLSLIIACDRAFESRDRLSSTRMLNVANYCPRDRDCTETHRSRPYVLIVRTALCDHADDWIHFVTGEGYTICLVLQNCNNSLVVRRRCKLIFITLILNEPSCYSIGINYLYSRTNKCRRYESKFSTSPSLRVIAHAVIYNVFYMRSR